MKHALFEASLKQKQKKQPRMVTFLQQSYGKRLFCTPKYLNLIAFLVKSQLKDAHTLQI